MPAGAPAIRRRDEARQRLFRAQAAERRARSQLEFRREAYRTALDADEAAGALRAQYRAAERNYAESRRERADAQRALTAAAPAAAEAPKLRKGTMIGLGAMGAEAAETVKATSEPAQGFFPQGGDGVEEPAPEDRTVMKQAAGFETPSIGSGLAGSRSVQIA